MNVLAPSYSPQARPTTSTRRRTALALSSVVAGSAVLAIASPASAFTPVAGAGTLAAFPASFQDTSGLTLQPCVDGSVQCGGTTAADVVAPDGEMFYNLMDGKVAGVRVVIALEGGFPNGPAEVFYRVRFKALGTSKGSLANAAYSITSRFGNASFTTDANGVGVSTSDTFCVAGAACGDTQFITSAAYRPGDAYVGNGAIDEPVAAANAVSVTVNGKTTVGNQFTVTGKVAAPGTVVTPGNPTPAVTEPGAPTGVRATGGRNGGAITADLAWTAPTKTGGAALTGYTVQAYSGITPVGTPQKVTGSSFTWTFAQRGNYSFTVAAMNSVGSSLSVQSNTVRAR